MDANDIAVHIPRLRRYARALVGDVTAADDLVQDTMERALHKFSLWQRGSNLRAWLFTIMHNTFVNQVRAGRLTTISMSEESGHMDIEVTPGQEQQIQIRDLVSALKRLPDEFREVVLLVGLEQLSYEETARVLGIPMGTVMSRLARGREKLRVLMAGEPVPVLRRVK